MYEITGIACRICDFTTIDDDNKGNRHVAARRNTNARTRIRLSRETRTDFIENNEDTDVEYYEVVLRVCLPKTIMVSMVTFLLKLNFIWYIL